MTLFPPMCRIKREKYLISNVRDEENHDTALGYIADAYGVEKAEAEAIASGRVDFTS